SNPYVATTKMGSATPWLVGGSAAAALLVAGSLSWMISGGSAIKPDPSSASIVGRGRAIYAQHCASWHGATLEGQPNWRERLPNGRLPAPPHDPTGHTWHHSDNELFKMVKKRHGRAGAGLRNRYAATPEHPERRRHLGRAVVHREHVAT